MTLPSNATRESKAFWLQNEKFSFVPILLQFRNADHPRRKVCQILPAISPGRIVGAMHFPNCSAVAYLHKLPRTDPLKMAKSASVPQPPGYRRARHSRMPRAINIQVGPGCPNTFDVQICADFFFAKTSLQ
jgi:hypothetical protein